MKKIFFLLIATSIILAGCVEKPAEQKTEIKKEGAIVPQGASGTFPETYKMVWRTTFKSTGLPEETLKKPEIVTEYVKGDKRRIDIENIGKEGQKIVNMYVIINELSFNATTKSCTRTDYTDRPSYLNCNSGTAPPGPTFFVKFYGGLKGFSELIKDPANKEVISYLGQKTFIGREAEGYKLQRSVGDAWIIYMDRKTSLPLYTEDRVSTSEALSIDLAPLTDDVFELPVTKS